MGEWILFVVSVFIGVSIRILLALPNSCSIRALVCCYQEPLFLNKETSILIWNPFAHITHRKLVLLQNFCNIQHLVFSLGSFKKSAENISFWIPSLYKTSHIITKC